MDHSLLPLSAFVLVGGASRRMGRDKAALEWGSQTLVEHMRGLLRPVAGEVRVVGGVDLPDLHPGQGPVEGIRTALAATETEENLIVAVDLPFIPTRLLEQIAESLRETDKPLVAIEAGHRIPLCLGVRKDLLTTVERYRESGGRSLAGFVEIVDRLTITRGDLDRLGLDPGIFRNINTWHDYQDAHQLAFGRRQQ